MTDAKPDFGTTEWECRSDTPCDVVVGSFVWGVQRCLAQGYKVINFDGNPWTVCREHYEAGR